MRSISVSILLGLGAVAGLSQQGPNVETHGTVNILLANANGMVLVTDSRASGTQFGMPFHEDDSPKLFKIDESTICSIAGFAVSPGPSLKDIKGWESQPLSLAAGGIIKAVIKEIADSPKKLTFADKADLTTQLSAIILTGFADAQRERWGPRVRVDDFYILIAGYDSAGGHIAKYVISANRAKSVELLKEERIASKVENLTAGVTDMVDLRLNQPEAFPAEPEIKAYSDAVKEGKSSQMTLPQLEALAIHLEDVAANNSHIPTAPDPVVGGPIQEAMLVPNQPPSLKLPPNLRDFDMPFSTQLITGSDLSIGLIAPNASWTTYANVRCGSQGSVLLDKAIFVSGTFENCTYFFDGEPFYRSPNVRFNGGTLILGPGLCDQSASLAAIRKAMPGMKEVWWTQLPISSSAQHQIWDPFRNHCDQP